YRGLYLWGGCCYTACDTASRSPGLWVAATAMAAIGGWWFERLARAVAAKPERGLLLCVDTEQKPFDEKSVKGSILDWPGFWKSADTFVCGRQPARADDQYPGLCMLTATACGGKWESG